MRAAVVGAGIAGLATAGGLRSAGAEVTVFEQSPQLRDGGAGLTLFGNGLRALDALGVGAAVRGLAHQQTPDAPAGIRDRHGRWLSRLGSTVISTTHVVERRALLACLVAGARDHIRWGATVDATDSESGSLLVNGERCDGFDLIVGADGIHSTVRRTWPDDPGVRYAGYHAWRGLTSGGVVVDGFGELWGSGQRFGVAPLRDGRIYWFATINGPRDAPPAGTVDAARRAFSGWHDDVERVLERTESSSVQALPLDELAADLPSFVRGRTAVVGDAAHAMTPNLGQGANQGLEDAATLVSLLAEASSVADIAGALRRYDEVRRPRTQGIAARSRRIGQVGQLQHPVAVWCRNAALRAFPDAVAERAALQVQRWSPSDA